MVTESIGVVQDSRYGTVSAILVALVWGFSFVAARVVLSTLTPILLASVRFCIASLIFMPIIVKELAQGRVPESRDLF
ncbi:MAG: EamA family transporter, partial [Candidatus Bathyarchaeota archaeon]